MYYWENRIDFVHYIFMDCLHSRELFTYSKLEIMYSDVESIGIKALF